jgi:hypothetical protein
MNKVSHYALIFAFNLGLGVGLNTAFAMGNDTAQRADRNAEHDCSPSTQKTGATAKSPNPNQPYNCGLLTAPEAGKNQNTTTAKTPQRESHTEQQTQPSTDHSDSDSSSTITVVK